MKRVMIAVTVFEFVHIGTPEKFFEKLEAWWDPHYILNSLEFLKVGSERPGI